MAALEVMVKLTGVCKGAAQPLDQASYAQLAKPTIKHPVTY